MDFDRDKYPRLVAGGRWLLIGVAAGNSRIGVAEDGDQVLVVVVVVVVVASVAIIMITVGATEC